MGASEPACCCENNQMANKMLIDATHPEETRVVVLRGNRVEEFDFESASRRQLRGNIYLAKVTRVEPSLQAAFVDYGGNRHGFLAFNEIHPDYYQIPVADRQALIEEEGRAARAAEAEADGRASRRRGRRRGAERPAETLKSEPVEAAAPEHGEGAASMEEEGNAAIEQAAAEPQAVGAAEAGESPAGAEEEPSTPEHLATAELIPEEPIGMIQQAESSEAAEARGLEETRAETDAEAGRLGDNVHHTDNGGDHEGGENGRSENGEHEEAPVESVGGADALEEVRERSARPRRQYKIQEVIKRRQIMLVQVVKEERGTKGAALTTYLSLAGRYSVLMPNTARGGGISRKITDATDRKRLKEIAQELEVPEGMGVILRTAGASRTKAEVKRDFEYLLRLWETVRDLTLKSTAPTLVYEEGSLVKRAIRDLYNKDIDEIIVAGDEAYKEAKEFMRMLMPSHAKNVKPYKDVQPLFTRYGIEGQLDAMFSPTVQLRSGGYIVINQAEALVAIDVNSGRATREHHIEDTALKTNLEAAEEVARQLRMRDLAGLIVIDFIDMEEKRNNRAVERRLKECLKHDRARIQVGGISHFGLLEMSRQRIRTSVLESSTEKCPTCGGTGHVRSVGSVALQLLRALEETLLKSATHNLTVRTRPEVAIYVLNHKRAHLRDLEERFQVTLTVTADPSVSGQISFVIDRGEQVHSAEAAKALLASQPIQTSLEIEEEEAEAEAEKVAEAGEERLPGEREEGGHRRKRRRKRRRSPGEAPESSREAASPEAESPRHEPQEVEGPSAEEAEEQGKPAAAERGEQPSFQRGQPHGEAGARRRRRGRRGGRRNRRGREEGEERPMAHNGHNDNIAAAGHTEATEAAESAEEPRFEPDTGSTESVPAALPEAELPPALPVAEPPAEERVAAKRGSTIREPAPTFVSGQGFSPPAARPKPAPQPAAEAEPASGEEDKPRRTGWWARRLLGEKE
jgi:ribonuclease E